MAVVASHLPPGPGQSQVFPVAAAQVQQWLTGGETLQELSHSGPGLVSRVGEMTRDLLVHGVDQLSLQQSGGLLQALPHRLLAGARGLVAVAELREVAAAPTVECFPSNNRKLTYLTSRPPHT